MTASCRAAGAVLLAALTATSGCARLVVVDRSATAGLNDEQWRMRKTAPVAVVAPVTGGDAKEEDAAPVEPLTQAVVVSEVAPPSPVVPLAPARPAGPAVPAAALASPRDEHGIPRDLYQHDPLLAAHADVMAKRVHSHRMVGAGTIALGAVMGGLSVLLFALAADAHDDAVRTGKEDRSGQAVGWAVIDAVFAAGLLGYGISDLATSADPSAMQRYYRDNYR